jgi:hypothetical protein
MMTTVNQIVAVITGAAIVFAASLRVGFPLRVGAMLEPSRG